MKIWSLSLFICFTMLAAQSVAQQKDSLSKGSLTIHADSRLDSLANMVKNVNESRQYITGYRVQIYFGAERKKANEIKSAFLQKYPEIPAYVVYHQPNYKVRLGDFRTRIEAYQLSHELLVDYPSAFIVKDDIPLPGLDSKEIK